MSSLVLASAVILGGCSGQSPSVQRDEAGVTFPTGAFDEPGPPGALKPSTTPTSGLSDPAAGCPGPATCRLSARGEPLAMHDGLVVFEYRVNPGGAVASSLAASELVAAIRAAAAEWTRHDARIKLVYRGTTRAAAGTAGVVAFGDACGHGGFPACTDRRTAQPSVTFAAAAPWMWSSCGPGGDGSPCTPYPQRCTSEGATEKCEGIDLQAVATHEWGHVLGLDDLVSPMAEGLTMFARARVADDRGALVLRDLSTIGLGDLVGLRRLYPGSTTARPITTP